MATLNITHDVLIHSEYSGLVTLRFHGHLGQCAHRTLCLAMAGDDDADPAMKGVADSMIRGTAARPSGVLRTKTPQLDALVGI